jgi:uncharacterized damage-inducible protein DinB
MRLLALCALAVFAFAQSDAAKSPFITEAKASHNQIKGLILKSAEKMPEEQFTFQPVPEVRTFAKVLGHIAGGNYLLCGAAKGEKRQIDNFEEAAPTRAALVKILNESFSYCDAVYDSLTDSSAAEAMDFFTRKRSRLSILNTNSMHNWEHYGNLVTYMRMKGVVPPSSEGRR